MIYEIGKEEHPTLCAIWESAVRATHHFLSKEDFEFYKTKLPSYLEQTKLYGFKKNGVLKGFLGVSQEQIEMLFVDNRYRNFGVGGKLLLYAINELGIKKVDVNEDNLLALGFYEKFGFKVISRDSLDIEKKPYAILHLEFTAAPL
ncbi:MAG: GNAT family N-acetyltransferase [Campylobacteraceae bacterium]|jgi:putative acetyltransferase|nr:GNAT family N-acetyltransferase [Campylobacteraceae bacterium]